ncbi:MAG: hypothetical protein ACLTDV_03865 [Eubacterium sp.]
MQIEQIEVSNFENTGRKVFTPEVNLIIGDNGTGKHLCLKQFLFCAGRIPLQELEVRRRSFSTDEIRRGKMSCLR